MCKNPVEFGPWFARIREASGYESQRQLSLESKVSNATIARIENGSFIPKPETLEKLAPYLNVTYETLMKKAGFLKSTYPLPQEQSAEKTVCETSYIKDIDLLEVIENNIQITAGGKPITPAQKLKILQILNEDEPKNNPMTFYRENPLASNAETRLEMIPPDDQLYPLIENLYKKAKQIRQKQNKYPKP